jgi:four helix bundle protein
MDDKTIENNPLLKLTLEFSLKIIKYCEVLEGQKKFVIARQLLRSGTSIGANSFEAQNSESRADFIHKLKIAAKETSETKYWLILCNRTESYPTVKELLIDLESIIKLLGKIVSSSIENKYKKD